MVTKRTPKYMEIIKLIKSGVRRPKDIFTELRNNMWITYSSFGTTLYKLKQKQAVFSIRRRNVPKYHLTDKGLQLSNIKDLFEFQKRLDSE